MFRQQFGVEDTGQADGALNGDTIDEGNWTSPVDFRPGRYGQDAQALLPLSEEFYDMKVSQTDTRSIGFFNPWVADGASPPDGLSVQAMINVGGTWTDENWTDQPSRVFCRQLNAERVDEIIVVVANAGLTKLPALPDGYLPEVAYNGSYCRGWSGILTGQRTFNGGGPTWQETWGGSIHLTRDQEFDSDQYAGVQYDLDPGHLDYNGEQDQSLDCSGSIPAQSVPFTLGDALFSTLNLEPSWRTDISVPRYFAQSFPFDVEGYGTDTCSTGPVPIAQLIINTNWFQTDDPSSLQPMGIEFDPKAGVYNGGLTFHDNGDPEYTTTLHWTLTPDPDE
jgi:hypothetical protein